MNPVGDLTENWDEKATSAGQPRPLHERVCSSSADSALHGFAENHASMVLQVFLILQKNLAMSF
jgi:hypothetical protein